ncbi:recombinase family protein [Brevibacillus daliensis]|uniref:recombinase family protein n=1 Tax=Brevibacillus daliensis TaxID=2892995 RepID=UPI001E295182|nr:recombinase family protein [Brevibacillus daliensis]
MDCFKLAYGRVSDKDQNPERQLVEFRELGVEDRFIFVDKQSGKDFERLCYQAMRMMIREGDLVYLEALDRLEARDQAPQKEEVEVEPSVKETKKRGRKKKEAYEAWKKEQVKIENELPLFERLFSKKLLLFKTK